MQHNKGEIWLFRIIIVMIWMAIMGLIFFAGYHRETDTKVGFIMTGGIKDQGWNGKHYQGIKKACEMLGVDLLIKENIAEGTRQCETAIQELIDDGAKAIILSSYFYPQEVKEVINAYPDIRFFSISAEYHADNLTSYFGKMYQARYLAGMIAGMQSENDRIGYVAAMPNSEVNCGINAFALGVKSVNQDANIYVVWTDSWENKEREIEAAKQLIDELGADVITYHQNQHYVAEIAEERGVYSIGCNERLEGQSDKYLTAVVWDWNSLYYEIIREYITENSPMERRRWLGMDSGAVQLGELSSAVSDEARKKVEQEKEELIAGKIIFAGTIFDNEGRMRCDAKEAISETVLLEQMDWFVDGVVMYE